MVSEDFLQLSKTIEKEVEELKLKDSATAKVAKAGIPPQTQPDITEYKAFPQDVTEIPNADLGFYLGIYEAEAGWLEYLISRRDIDLSHGLVLLEFVKNKILVKSRALHPSLKTAEHKERLLSDTFFLKSLLEIEDIKADLSILNASKNNFERYARTISREITSRKSAVENFPKGRVTSNTEQSTVFNKR